MPKVTSDWEAEYHDPASDLEDELAAERERRLDEEIMFEIEMCKLEAERREQATLQRELEHREYMEEMEIYGDVYTDDELADLDDLHSAAEYDYEHWS